MTQEQLWTKEETVEVLKSPDRRLDIMFPPLRSYLKPGMKVLDVGCGPGSMTLDVAEVVYPGEIVGLDFSEPSITEARTAAETAQRTNVKFEVGNTYAIPFADATFDLVYSTNVLGWLQEPVQSLAEQRRVTKPNSWVCTLLGDYGNITWYPPCPTIDRFVATLGSLRELNDSQAYIDSHQGRRVIELFSLAGFSEIQIQGWADNLYRSIQGFDEAYSAWRQIMLNKDGLFSHLHYKLIEEGLLDEQTLLAAQNELDQWYQHPYAFYTQTQFLAAGRV